MRRNSYSCRWKTTCILGFVLFAVFLTNGPTSGEPPPVANFTELTSTATEDNGRITLKVTFSRDFSGELRYSIDGTATRNKDFEAVDFTNTTHPVRELAIVINLRDDASIENIETVRVTLQPGRDFQLGPAPDHTVSIRDNDETFHVLHDFSGMQFGYRLQIIRNGTNTSATVTSDGGNGLPAGTYPVKLTADMSRFDAIVGPIFVAADQTLLGADIARTFVLRVRPLAGETINYDRRLIGSVTETWASAGGPHLTQRTAILGTFLMWRAPTDANTPQIHDNRPVTTTTKEPTFLTSTTECPGTEVAVTNEFTVKPRPEAPSPQSFAPFIPYSDFIQKTYRRVGAALYYDRAPTQATKQRAAFRYKTLLYEREHVGAETYIRAHFKKIGSFWDCAARQRAHRAAESVIDVLRYAPWNRSLRRFLLDIYYDIAVAEKALAQDKHAAVAELMIQSLGSRDPLIDKEIAQLEQALPIYRNALAGYMRVLQGTFGVNVADFEDDPELMDVPFGYYIFRKEVPSRSPLAAVSKNTNGDWVLPGDGSAHGPRPPLFNGYKDVTLLFELLREHLRTAGQLSNRYLMRGEPNDRERAERLIETVLLTTYLEGHALLATFPEIQHQSGPVDPASGLKEAVAGWRHSYTVLNHIHNRLPTNTNPLGFSDDFLVLIQSVIPGAQQARFFNSYDFFADYLLSNGGPVQRAEKHLREALQEYDKYRDRNDDFLQQFSDRSEQYDERLTKIVGARPGTPSYRNPTQNDAGLIHQQLSKIQSARVRLKQNRQKVNKIEEEIRIELWRRGNVARINDAISQVHIKFGHIQAKLTDEIAEIQANQVAVFHGLGVLGSWLTAGIGVAAAPFTAGASLMLTAAAVPNFIASGLNASAQPSAEINKGRLQALKERHDARQRAEVQTLHRDLLDVDSRALVKNRLLEMSLLSLETTEATLILQQDMQRLSALYLEKADLEHRKAESTERLANRYFADPSHRVLKNASLLRAEFSFTNAQRWMFLAIRAAQYKWNQVFEYTDDAGITYTMHTLFRARNARELRNLFDALADWNRKMSLGIRNDDGYKKFSIREDFFSYKGHIASFHPKTGEPMSANLAFRHFLAREENYLNPEDPENPIRGFKVLKLRFNTAVTPDTGGLFLRNRWLEKVKFLRVKLHGGAVGDINSTVDGFLTYGGISLIRNQRPGYQEPQSPDRWIKETTAYSTRYWFYRNGQWRSKNAFGSPISIQVSNDPDVPPEIYQINSFREYSVATSDWTLYIAVERNGRQLVDTSNLSDIEFHINYYWYVRN